MKIERCCDCDEPTGKAGAGDGSLFQGAYGPLCDKCFDEWPDKMTAEVARLNGIIRNHEVAERVPEGWHIVERNTGSIIVYKEKIGSCVVSECPETERTIPEAILWALAKDILAAAPAQEKV